MEPKNVDKVNNNGGNTRGILIQVITYQEYQLSRKSFKFHDGFWNPGPCRYVHYDKKNPYSS